VLEGVGKFTQLLMKESGLKGHDDIKLVFK
jgi:hypothetical protein